MSRNTSIKVCPTTTSVALAPSTSSLPLRPVLKTTRISSGTEADAAKRKAKKQLPETPKNRKRELKNYFNYYYR